MSIASDRVNTSRPDLAPASWPLVSQTLHPDHTSVLVAAHRGAWHSAPENSIASIEAAISLGADIVECDVRTTRDGTLVLFHDATLDRMTSFSGEVADMDWAELRKTRLRRRDGGMGSELSTEPPSTLSEALECARGRVILNIDTKSGDLVDRVAKATMAAGMAGQVFVKAFVNTPADLEGLRASPFFGQVPFVPMLKARLGSLRATLAQLAVWGFPMYEVEFASLEDLQEARPELEQQQARLWVNTIQVSHSLTYNDKRAIEDPDAVWGRLLSVGVGAIQTDEVGPLLNYLKLRGMR